MSSTAMPPAFADSGVQLLNLRQIASLLGCSTRHVVRLADDSKMPRPVRLGHLLRWPAKSIETWIASGCPESKEGDQ